VGHSDVGYGSQLRLDITGQRHLFAAHQGEKRRADGANTRGIEHVCRRGGVD